MNSISTLGWILVTKAGKPAKRNCARIDGKVTGIPKVKIGSRWKRVRGIQKPVIITIEELD